MCDSREFEHAMQLIYCRRGFSQGSSLKPFTGSGDWRKMTSAFLLGNASL